MIVLWSPDYPGYSPYFKVSLLATEIVSSIFTHANITPPQTPGIRAWTSGAGGIILPTTLSRPQQAVDETPI